VDLVQWYCSKHGKVYQHPDDGRDRKNSKGRRTQKPIPPICPGPWDNEKSEWTREGCDLELRRRVVSD
jgi:hypothetical protein